MSRALRCLPLLFLIACATQAPVKPAAYSPTILISFDGYRNDYIERNLSPTLQALANDGVRATALRSAFPTLTFPNHYTIVTGLYPDHSGIVHNRMFDPVSKKSFVYNRPETTNDPMWWGGEPLWNSVERQGKHAATMFWPGSDVEINGQRPSHWLAFNGKLTPNERIDQVLAWMDLPPDQRPVFITLYFEQVDHAGHDFSPDSPEVNAALTEVDGALARLVDGLKQRGTFAGTNLVIVSDHGMTAAGEDKVVVIDKAVNIAHVEVLTAGVLAGIVPTADFSIDDEKTLLGPHEHMRCWKKSEMPPRMHYGSNPRIPPLLCLADDGYVIDTQSYLDKPNRHISHGEHGYDNDDPKMRALFVAHGPAFKRALVVQEFDNVDIYPMLAHILSIQPAPNDGDYTVVKPMLVNP